MTLGCRDDSVLMSGLELINIKVLEYAQQNLARIATSSTPWGTAAWEKTLALYNSDFLTAGNISLLKNCTLNMRVTPTMTF